MAFGLMGYWLRSHFQKYVQWNGTFRLHRPDPIHRAFGYCSCKQDTKERYWGQQFCQMERDISVRPTEITGPVKVDHLQSWPEYSGRTKSKWLMYQSKFPEFWVEWKAPVNSPHSKGRSIRHGFCTTAFSTQKSQGSYHCMDTNLLQSRVSHSRVL